MNLKYNYWFFKNALASHECSRIIKYGLSQKDQRALTGIEGNTASDKNLRNSHVSFFSEPWIYKLILPYVQIANKNSGWNYEWSYTEPIQFTKYKLDQHYDWHTDSYFEPINKPQEKTHNQTRKLSCCVALNNSSEYTGGELEIASYSQKGELIPMTCEAMKEEGSIVVFPSFVFHRVTPVTKGTRYSLVTWSLGWPFK